MEKYIAFGLYQKNEHGGHTAVRAVLTGGDPVYLATDVEAFPQRLINARLTWAMACPCKCQACAEFDDAVKDLMVT